MASARAGQTSVPTRGPGHFLRCVRDRGGQEELREIIDFLKDPKKFTRLGGGFPRGGFYGSPGTARLGCQGHRR